MKNNDVYIHSDNTISYINKRYLLVLIPLLIFGFYKNGIIVFSKNNTNTFDLFKPILIPLIGFMIGFLAVKLFNYYKKNNKKVFSDYNLPIQTLIISMIMPTNINIIVYTIILFVLSLIYMFFIYNKKFKINFITMSSLILIITNYLLGNYESIYSSFYNSYEMSTLLNHSLFRLFLGYGVGGLASTSFVFVVIAYIIMSFMYSYKKEIPFYLTLLFGSFILIKLLVTNNVVSLIDSVLNSSLPFVIVLVSTFPNHSPYTKVGMFIYSLLIFIFSILFSSINFELSVLFSITLVSLTVPFLNKIFKKTKF